MQAQRIARHGAGDCALHIAVLQTRHHIGQSYSDRNTAKRPDKIGLPDGRNTHAPARQIAQPRQTLLAKEHLGWIGIDSQRFNAMLVPQGFLQEGPKSRQAGLQARNIGVEACQIGRGELWVLCRQRTHERGTKWNHSQLEQTHHLHTRYTGAIKRNNVGSELATTQALQFMGPERLLPSGELVQGREAPNHTYPVGCRGRRLCRYGKGTQNEHAAPQGGKPQ